jgi:hypothetical protein
MAAITTQTTTAVLAMATATSSRQPLHHSFQPPGGPSRYAAQAPGAGPGLADDRETHD